MIVRPAEADRFAAHPPSPIRAALFFGPDQGAVRERAETMAKSVVPDLSDPFRVAELGEESLGADPARLFDEASAISMMGGRRVVRVRGAGNALAKLFERFLAEAPGDALVVVEAGELTKSASLRRVFESADNGAAIACYADTARNLDEVVRAGLKAEGLAIEPGALALCIARLGSDRGVTRHELEKLALYAQGEKTVTEAHIQAVLGDESELRMEETCDAAGEGDFARLDRALSRLWEAGTSPVAVLRLALAHFQRLLSVKAEAETGGDAGAALRRLRPPVHFSRKRSFDAQMARWPVARLEEALALLYEAEALTKTTAIPAEAACGRALLSVAAMARARR